jgi:hypothetical protein
MYGGTEEQRKRKVPLFNLVDGTPVYFGDVLWHPDRRCVGWYCVANFALDGDGEDSVTVNSPNGAVPTVLIEDLRRVPPVYEQVTCPTCKGAGKVAIIKGPLPFDG